MYTFGQIIGNERLIDSLRGFIKLDRVPHAVIFSGEKGIGKKTIAGAFAKALLCEQKGIESCNSCVSCRTFESGNNSDVIYVTASKASIGADDIREQIVRNVHIKPYSAKYKIFIMDDADKMTAAAQNAILKSLEDSPQYAVFLLLARNDGLFLPTVVSRCVLYRMSKLPVHQVRDFLVRGGISEADANLAAVFSDGNIGRAQALQSDADFIEMRGFITNIADNIKKYDLIKIFSTAKSFEPYKERIQEALDIFLLYYRDALVLRAANRKFLICPDISAERGYPVHELCNNIAAVLNAKEQLRRYANFQLTIEIMLMKLGAAFA